MSHAIVLHHSHDQRVAHVTVANEAKLNTLTPPLMAELAATFATFGHTPSLRAVILRGAGSRAFIGGADIPSMARLADAAEARAFIRLVHGCCRAIRDCPVPVIAVIRGFCLGAGLEIAASCDLRLADDTAQFGMPEVRLGLPAVVEAALLPTLIGWGRARRLMLLGETIGAAEALQWGLVERVVPKTALDAALEAWIGLLEAAGAEAIRAQKALMRRWEDLPLSEAIAAGIDAFAAAWHSAEPQHLLNAFLARRASRHASRRDPTAPDEAPARTPRP